MIIVETFHVNGVRTQGRFPRAIATHPGGMRVVDVDQFSIDEK
jgi:hypothetical protein